MCLFYGLFQFPSTTGLNFARFVNQKDLTQTQTVACTREEIVELFGFGTALRGLDYHRLVYCF